jgi:putative DNA primase/helicase
LHNDHRPSLSASRGDDDGLLVHCFACDSTGYFEAFVKLVRDGIEPDPEIRAATLAAVKTRPPLVFTPTAWYEYVGADGLPLRKYRGTETDPETGEVIETKTFRWKRRVSSKWWWGLQEGSTPRLYRPQPAVSGDEAAHGPVWVCEGERDADSLAVLGCLAVSPAMGAGVWTADYTAELHDADEIRIVADDDEPGRNHAVQVRDALHADRPDRAVTVLLPATGKDVTDHLDAGFALDALRVVAEAEGSAGPRARRPKAKSSRAEQKRASAQYVYGKGQPDGTITDEHTIYDRECAVVIAAAPRFRPDDDGEQGGEEGTAGEQRVVVTAPPSDPVAVAQQLVDQVMRYAVDNNLVVRWWRGDYYVWDADRWSEIANERLRSALYRALAQAFYPEEMPFGPPILTPWQPNRRKIGDVLEALQALVHLNERADPPDWIEPPDDGEVISVHNGLLHLVGRRLDEHTPRLFNLTALSYPYTPVAPKPRRWLRFLDELWPDDPESIALLQEFFGYVISSSTDQHKIALMVGPPRSGKGTITRTLTGLVGPESVAAPTLAALGTNFGLQPLIGKSLAAVGDVRLGPDTFTVTERLLSISGEDTLTIDRKYRTPWTGRLGVRFLLSSNELPRLGDASGALASRFIVLQLTRSWLGHEDLSLGRALETELASILNWSLDGLDRLRQQGRFTAPASSTEAITALEDLSSPIRQFLREETVTGAGQEVPVDDIYARFRWWCFGQGRDRIQNKQVFGRDLRAALPGIGVSQPRDGDRRHRVYRGIALRPAEETSPQTAFQRVPTPPARDGTRTPPMFHPPTKPMRACAVPGCDQPAIHRWPNGHYCADHAPDRRQAP